MFHYVCILVSETDPARRYVGSTRDLQARLAAHNAGKVRHAAKHRPWRMETAVAFRCSEKASAFEKYLKPGSGRSFARRHL